MSNGGESDICRFRDLHCASGFSERYSDAFGKPSSELADFLYLVGRKVNKRAKLEEIWEMAGSTAALPHALDSLAVGMFRVTLRRYQGLNSLRAELEQRAERALAGNADFEHLKTLPGVTQNLSAGELYAKLGVDQREAEASLGH